MLQSKLTLASILPLIGVLACAGSETPRVLGDILETTAGDEPVEPSQLPPVSDTENLPSLTGNPGEASTGTPASTDETSPRSETAGPESTGDVAGSSSGAWPWCPENALPCDSQDFCYLESTGCDGLNNCPDGSDELECQCEFPGIQFPCGDGACINAVLGCNGVPECSDGSDEANCTPCAFNQIECGDGDCLPHAYLCDDFQDCSDGLDEAYCDDE